MCLPTSSSTSRATKISTSRNWAVWLHEYLADFPGKQDVLRYVLTANAPETKDNDFTWRDFQARNNNEAGGCPRQLHKPRGGAHSTSTTTVASLPAIIS